MREPARRGEPRQPLLCEVEREGRVCSAGPAEGRVSCPGDVSEAPRPLLWHDTPGSLAGALRAAGPARVRRVHTFRLRPGLLGGLYSASFADLAGAVHRCILSYRDSALLQWELRPLEDALRTLAVVEVEGRVEVGANTGDVLHYFLSGSEEGESPGRAERRRRASAAAWVRACRALPLPPRLRLAEIGEGAGVLAATHGADHLLLRVDARGEGSADAASGALGAPPPELLAAGEPLARDILGQWRER